MLPIATSKASANRVPPHYIQSHLHLGQRGGRAPVMGGWCVWAPIAFMKQRSWLQGRGSDWFLNRSCSNFNQRMWTLQPLLENLLFFMARWVQYWSHVSWYARGDGSNVLHRVDVIVWNCEGSTASLCHSFRLHRLELALDKLAKVVLDVQAGQLASHAAITQEFT